jgi:ABC-type Zn2+ transport system substrate-binding protein/surface adhesin
MEPVLKGQTAISSLPLFDVRGVRLMGLPTPVKPDVKPDPPQIKVPQNKQVAQMPRQISVSDLHHKYPDPYIWLDPRNGIAMVRAITARLSGIDPENGPMYRRNSAALVSQIEALDQELQVRFVPVREAPYVALDRSFQYFERQYDLEPKVRLHDSNTAMTEQEAAAAHRKLAAARLPCVVMPTTAAYGKEVVKGMPLRVAWVDPYGRDLHRRDGYAVFLRSVADRLTACLTGRRSPAQ